jgi:SAM-dependent methyltransferase
VGRLFCLRQNHVKLSPKYFVNENPFVGYGVAAVVTGDCHRQSASIGSGSTSLNKRAENMLSQNHVDALRRQFRTTESWRIRHQTHEKYTFPRKPFIDWAMSLVPWRGDERILDVGCGPGKYYDYFQAQHPGLRYIGLDYSYAMVSDHKGNGQITRGTMEELPFADDSFDVVMANHVIYLAPDVEATIAEFKRVLKPGGMLIAATTSVGSTPQFRELFRRTILLVSPPGRAAEVKIPETLHRRFALENGTRLLSRQFFAVARYDLPSALVFPAVDPIMDYLEATRSIRESQLPEDVGWDQLMLIMREQLTNLMYTHKTLAVDKLTGVLMASDQSGFIGEYQQIAAKLNGHGG